MATATLTWGYTHTNELGFECERKTGTIASGGSYSVIGSTNVGVLTLVDSTVSEGVTYCFRVRAWNNNTSGAKQYSAYSNVVEFTPNIAPPPAPTGLTVS